MSVNEEKAGGECGIELKKSNDIEGILCASQVQKVPQTRFNQCFTEFTHPGIRFCHICVLLVISSISLNVLIKNIQIMYTNIQIRKKTKSPKN